MEAGCSSSTWPPVPPQETAGPGSHNRIRAGGRGRNRQLRSRAAVLSTENLAARAEERETAHQIQDLAARQRFSATASRPAANSARAPVLEKINGASLVR
jgi:hypothetical protein